MLLPILVRRKAFGFIVLVIASYATSLAIFIFSEPAPIANIIGLLSLLCYAATLIPGLCKAIFPASKKNQILIWLARNRRYTGVAAFSFGLNHGVLLILERHLNLLDYRTDIHCLEGLTTLLIFTVLAVTSNDWTVKSLKNNWKQLHKLTYLAIFLLPWHILAKMGGHWSHLTPLGLLITLAIVILFISRKWFEQLNSEGQPEFSRKGTMCSPSWSHFTPLALLVTKATMILLINKKWIELVEPKHQPEFSDRGTKLS